MCRKTVTPPTHPDRYSDTVDDPARVSAAPHPLAYPIRGPRASGNDTRRGDATRRGVPLATVRAASADHHGTFTQLNRKSPYQPEASPI
jgi:hypothetical protein